MQYPHENIYILYKSKNFIFKFEIWSHPWIAISPENNANIIHNVNFYNFVFTLVISFEAVLPMPFVSKMG